MSFVEFMLAWWLLIGIYYVLNTFLQDVEDQEAPTIAYRLGRGIILLPIMPLMVAISLLFKNLLVVGVANESEE